MQLQSSNKSCCQQMQNMSQIFPLFSITFAVTLVETIIATTYAPIVFPKPPVPLQSILHAETKATKKKK